MRNILGSLIVVLAFVTCGDSQERAASGEGGVEATTTPSVVVTTTTAEVPAPTTTTTAPPPPVSAEWCAKARESAETRALGVSQLEASRSAQVTSAQQQLELLEEALATFNRAEGLFRELEPTAPVELQDDFYALLHIPRNSVVASEQQRIREARAAIPAFAATYCDVVLDVSDY